MNFEKDLFISYAHIDNEALKEGEKGWVANFHRALEVRLSQLLGERPHIWRDQKLQGNDVFSKEIVGQFPKTALLMSILSPRYTKSEWCTKEVNEFFEVAQNGIGTTIDNKSRIFKVIKTPVKVEQQPEKIQDTLGYEFFKVDPETGRARELNQLYGSALEEAYWARLDDLAHDICDLLEKVKDSGEGHQEINHVTPSLNGHAPDTITVYLAESSSDISEQRDAIKRELQEFGYKVVPEAPLPTLESEYKKKVRALLDKSQITVHMIGGNYGMVPENGEQSAIALQNELAAVKSKKDQNPRLIWLPPGIKARDERQERFLEAIQTQAKAQEGAELFQTSIEDLKGAIHARVKKIREANEPILSNLYLADAAFAIKEQRTQLKKHLQQQGYKILPEKHLAPVADELEKQARQALEQSDIAILMVGGNYSLVPEGTEYSHIDLQYRQILKNEKIAPSRRLVWLDPEMKKTKDTRLAAFIKELESTKAIDLIECPIEALDKNIDSRLTSIEEKERAAKAAKEEEAAVAKQNKEAAGDSLPGQIYLICEEADLDQITELEDYLFDQGHEVILPAFDGDEAQIREDHEENLKLCDAVLIYYGKGKDLWMRSKSRDLLKVAGLGREKELLGKAVILAEPATRQKERFRSQDSMVINALEGFSGPLMEDFIKTIQ